MNLRVSLIGILLLSALQVFGIENGFPIYRSWTSRQGSSIEATLKAVAGDIVTLQKRDKSTVDIHRGQLSVTDRAFLEGGYPYHEKARTWTTRFGQTISAAVRSQEDNKIVFRSQDGTEQMLSRDRLCDADLIRLDSEGYLPHLDTVDACWRAVTRYLDLENDNIISSRKRKDGRVIAMPYAAYLGRKALQRAAELGDLNARVQLGCQLSTGKHPAFENLEDHEAARKWFRLAAKSGHSLALYNLALYERQSNPTLAAQYLKDAGRQFAKDGNREMALKTVDRLREVGSDAQVHDLKTLVDQTFVDHAEAAGQVLFDPRYIEDPVSLLLKLLSHKEQDALSVFRFAEYAALYCLRGRQDDAHAVLQTAIEQGISSEQLLKEYYEDVQQFAVDAFQTGQRTTFDTLNAYLHNPPHREQLSKERHNLPFTAFSWYPYYRRSLAETLMSQQKYVEATAVLLAQNVASIPVELPPVPTPLQLVDRFADEKKTLLLLCKIASSDAVRHEDPTGRFLTQFVDNYMGQKHPRHRFHCACIHKMLGNDSPAQEIFQQTLALTQRIKRMQELENKNPSFLAPWFVSTIIGHDEKQELAVLYNGPTKPFIDAFLAVLPTRDRILAESLLMRLDYQNGNKESGAQRIAYLLPALKSVELYYSSLGFVAWNFTAVDRPELVRDLSVQYMKSSAESEKRLAEHSQYRTYKEPKEPLALAYWRCGLLDDAWSILDKQPNPKPTLDWDSTLSAYKDQLRQRDFWLLDKRNWVQRLLKAGQAKRAESYIWQTQTSEELAHEVGMCHAKSGNWESALASEGNTQDVYIELLEQFSKKMHLSILEKEALRSIIAQLTD